MAASLSCSCISFIATCSFRKSFPINYTNSYFSYSANETIQHYDTSLSQPNLEHVFRIVQPDEFLHSKWEGINATAPFFQRRWMSSQWGANDPRGPSQESGGPHMPVRVGRGDYMSWPQIYVSRSGSRQIETSSNINPHLYIIHAIFTTPRWSMRSFDQVANSRWNSWHVMIF